MKLGIVIPYYRNSVQCEKNFSLLMDVIERQLTDDVYLCVIEDGQHTNWLDAYKDKGSIIRFTNNMGVSIARNFGIDCCMEKHCDYILFIDSDDMIDSNYITKILSVLNEKWFYDIYETNYFINNVMKEYRINDIRSSACASVIKSELIGNLRFKENIQIGEDTLFMQELFYRKSDITREHVNTNYYYNLGSNLNSLTMRHLRHEIGIEREDNNENK